MRGWLVVALLLLTIGRAAPVAAAPEGELTWAVHVSLAPTWFDPAETPGVIVPFMVLYALHDALAKPMPGAPMAPSLAESWSVFPDGLVYDFVLRAGVRFHNGDPVSAEDVKFSLERYRGGAAATLKARVATVEVVDARRLRIRLKQPWPDFLTFYATPATGAAWIVPKRYIERVGEDGFKKAPIGAGPYRFVSFTPGVELGLEAFDGYWRKTPAVKRLVFRSVPDESTRLAMLKRGEADIAYAFRGPLVEELRRTPGLTLKATSPTFTEWLTFTEQWDPTHDPARTRQLLAEAGYPRGFDAGEIASDLTYAPSVEAVINDLQPVGIRARLRALERAAYLRADQEKGFKRVVRIGSAAAGNAATRIEAFVITNGIRSYGGYPEIDALYREQATERDPKKREALLHRIQQAMYERVMFVPIVEPAFLNGVGPRVEEAGLGLIAGHLYSAPYEDLRIKPGRR
jgi:peptide/nickel transport system substrate-binding protein